MKKLKKGFTLVELVIVIAVIAVLAAVLIPTFTGIVQRAKVSNDTTLVKSLNTTMAEVDVQGRPTSVAEAIEVVETDGIKLSKLTATANGYNIVYDLEQNRFVLLDGKNGVAYQDPNKDTVDTSKLYKLWKIVQPKQAVNNIPYSVYLTGGNYNTIDVVAGVEVAKGVVVKQINYTNIGAAQDVVIRTNSANTELTVNAPSDTVKHYDSVGTVHVIAVDSTNCYEENGKAAFTQVDSGKYKTTATADVELLFVSNAANVKVAVTTGTVDQARVISDTDANTINGTNPGVTFTHDENMAFQKPEGVTEEEIKAVFEHNKGLSEVIAVITKSVQAECEHKNLTQTPAKASDCENDGCNEYWTCDDCGAIFKADKVTKTTVEAEKLTALGHDYKWNNVVGNGQHTLVCSHDSSHTITEDCDVTNVGDVCSVCGYEKVDPYLVMLAQIEAGTAPSTVAYTSSAIAYYWDTVNDSNCGYIFDVYTKDDTTDLDFEKARNTSSTTNWVILLKDVDLAGVQYPQKPAVKCNFDFNGHTVSLVKDSKGLCVPLAIGQKDITIKSSKVAPNANIKVGTSTTTKTLLTTSTVSSIFYTGNYSVTFSDIIIDSGKEIAIANNGGSQYGTNVTLKNCTINSDGFNYSQTLTSGSKCVYNSLICMLNASTSSITNLTLDNCNITMKNSDNTKATAVITYLDRQNSSTKGFGSLVVKGGTKITTCNNIPIFDLYETEDSGNNKEHNEYNMPNIHDRTTHCLVLEECSFNQSLDSKTGTILDPTSTYNTGTDWFVEKVGYSKFKYYEPCFNLTDCVASGYELSANANADEYWTVTAK